MFRKITRTVWLLSIVSLMNDFSSEMLYPIIPLFLQQIGYSTVLIGILEGVAELIAGLSKIYMGSVSDSFQRRLPFVNIGYSLSVLSRPLIGLTSFIGFVFLGRSMDKIGKGIRTGARDALLAEECNEENRAEVFGFHSSMDTVGAILGPLVAIIYLYFNPEDYRTIFIIALAPGLIAAIVTFFVKEKKRDTVPERNFSLQKNFSFYKVASKEYLLFTGLFLVFGLVNSSDMFLLLRAKEAGISESHVIFLYILFNLVYSLFAFPIGKLADRYGRMRMMILGLLIYAVTYFVFGLSSNPFMIGTAFIGYGLYYAFTRSTLKAILLQHVLTSQKSSAVGFFEGLNSFCLLAANAIAGFVWYRYGSVTMFLATGIIVLVVIILLVIKRNHIRPNIKQPID